MHEIASQTPENGATPGIRWLLENNEHDRLMKDSLCRVALTRLLDDLVQALPGTHSTLLLGRTPIGSVSPEFAHRLLTDDPALEHGEGWLRIESPMTAPELSARWGERVARLRGEGWFKAWRDEAYDVIHPDDEFAEQPYCQLERGVFRRFGLLSRAIYLNAWTPDGRMWIARRAASKAVDPGLLDNLVGGGIGAGEAVQQTLLRECFEEAGIPPELGRHAVETTRLRSRRSEDEGVHHEVLHVFNVRLPVDFVPRNQDGEVADFMLIDRVELTERVLAGEFTADAGAVAAHWLLRQGFD